ncbi:Cation channel sperm-associated protein 2 [Labeo rohita]|uniref:Cation channel sperm-associated protein 2 n=1 Tax=Labeo rohita TaxID=84645 RepID=A0ABQ8LC68_LABRO|nr:Cation channel sperm-associated protein 2 [Labeo rohita]
MSSVSKGLENTCESKQHEDNISVEENLSPRAQIIRRKFINMLDSCDLLPEREEHKHRPQHTVKDVTDQERYTSLENEYDHLVRFDVRRQKKDNITLEQRRLNRILNRHSRYPPLNMFAHWILEKFHDYKDPNVDNLFEVLQLLNWTILEIYILEIILKWLDDFWLFWRSPWNVFDFAVTLMPMLPAILPETFKGALIPQKFLKLLTQFRILRCLKIVSRFHNMRLMLQIIYKACRTVKMIFPVLLMSFLVFAVFGVLLFRKYTNSNVEGLLYKDDFKDISSAFITLFSIFTFEHWLDLLKDIKKVPELNHLLCGSFIMVWLVFAALMSFDDFQQIRNNLSKEVEQLKILRRAEIFKASNMGAMNQTNQLNDHKPVQDEEKHESLNISLDRHTSKHEREWNMGLEAFIQAAELDDDCKIECWREDNLYRYFELMEKLLHNLEEMERLQNILGRYESKVFS